MKVFNKLFCATKYADDGEVPLGFVTPYETTKAGIRRQETVKDWARSWPNPNKTKDPFIFDNVPRTGFKITDDIKRRYWGGGNVVFRVYDPAGFELEIQSQNLMMLINECGIKAGGEIEGQCIWGRDGAHNILLHETSEHFKNALMVEHGKKITTISKSDLVPGGVYTTKSGKTHTFLGVRYMIREEYSYATTPSQYLRSTGRTLLVDKVFVFSSNYLVSYYGKYPVECKKSFEPVGRIQGHANELSVEEATYYADNATHVNASFTYNAYVAGLVDQKPKFVTYAVADELPCENVMDFIPNAQRLSFRHQGFFDARFDEMQHLNVIKIGDTIYGVDAVTKYNSKNAVDVSVYELACVGNKIVRGGVLFSGAPELVNQRLFSAGAKHAKLKVHVEYETPKEKTAKKTS